MLARLSDVESEVDKRSAERELIDKAKSGDPSALGALVEAYYQQIFRTAYRWLGHRADAEDVTQKVALRMIDAIGSYNHTASFGGWIYRITINMALDLQRSQSRRGRYKQAYAMTITDTALPGQEDSLAVEDLWKQVRALPEKQRDAVLLVHGEGLSYTEAAEIMGCKETTVSWHISNARKALKGLR